MAIDGIEILESDYGIDIQNEILDLYDNQKSEKEIESHLKSELQKLTKSLDVEIFITSSCLTLWEIGMLNSDFFRRLVTLVEKGADKFWLDHSDPENFEKRNLALQQLLTKVKEPNSRIRKRKKYKNLLKRLFKKGEVLAVLIGDEYRCIIFENSYQYRKDAYHSFVATTYNKTEMPTIDDLWIEEIPVVKTYSGHHGVRKLDIYYEGIENFKSAFVKIGTMKLDPHVERLGFERRVSIDNLSDLKKEIDDILLGHKTELYACYTI